MTGVKRRTEDWRTLPWSDYQRNVYRLQKRIYQAARRGDWKRVHNLQRLLLRSWSARCLAVRQVTQDSRGKRTPGVDGVASLAPEERLAYAGQLRCLTRWTVDPIRRTYIPKPNNPTEKRGLGIPTLRDRARQALVKLALEPEWEAQFEPNSYGFRPGRSAHDAIEAIPSTSSGQASTTSGSSPSMCWTPTSRNASIASRMTACLPSSMRRSQSCA